MRTKLVVAALALACLAPPVPGASATERITLDGVPVSRPAHTSQVITVRHTTGTHARVTLWSLRSGRWHAVARTSAGRTGYGGLVDGTKRRQGSGTTPLGTYFLPWAFGSHWKQSTWDLPYRKFDGDDYWVEDNASAYYNRYRSKEQGGFRWNLTTGVNASERLADYPTEYRMSVVVAYNYYDRVRYRGAGIFLHVNGPGATAGCVSAPSWFMSVVMDNLDPDRRPVIAIGR